MADDLRATLESQLPQLFARALGQLERHAEHDAGAAAALAGLEPAANTLLRWSGTAPGELWLRVARAGLLPGSAADAASFGHALGLSNGGARHLLALLGREGFDLVPLARSLSTLCSADARELLANTWYGFDLEVTRVPVFGDLRASIALGRASLRATPEFTLRIDYDDLADASEQRLPLGALFMAGKVQIDGDVAKAMLLGMTLAQLP